MYDVHTGVGDNGESATDFRGNIGDVIRCTMYAQCIYNVIYLCIKFSNQKWIIEYIVESNRGVN